MEKDIPFLSFPENFRFFQVQPSSCRREGESRRLGLHAYVT